MSFYSGLLDKKNLKGLWQESKSFKQKKGSWPMGFLLGAVQINYPIIRRLLPDKWKLTPPKPADWLVTRADEPFSHDQSSLQDHLLDQVKLEPLPSLLRYEDRNSMAFSVESRVPFMDYRLIEFTLGLPERLIYRNGVKKYLLRKSFRGVVPDKILDRKDKMGFVSEEENWLKGKGKEWFYDNLNASAKRFPEYLKREEIMDKFASMISGESPFDFTPWRISSLNHWVESIR